MHNHFIVKSLELVRPGGLVAVLTSRYTMDATNPGARRAMGELADLVTAVRLPSRAHWRGSWRRPSPICWSSAGGNLMPSQLTLGGC